MRLFVPVAAAALAALTAACATMTLGSRPDPYKYMEEVEGVQAIAWVRAQNARTLGQLEADPRFAPMRAEALAIVNSKERGHLTGGTALVTLSGVEAKRRPDAEFLPNPVDAVRFPIGDASPKVRKEVLWIGRYDRHHKRPHLALEVARLCPGIPFHFIINPGDQSVEQEIRSECPSNVRLDGYVPNDLMPEVYRSSRLFLCTGSNAYEGFPNVLLEAASSGTPTVSLEEFDGFLERSNAGVSSEGQVTGLAVMIRELWEMPPAWHEHSQSGAEYVRREHTLDQGIQRFLEAIQRPNNSPSQKD